MGKELILVASVTYAMKGREILSRNGIKAYIERTPKNLNINSCGYCLYVPFNIDRAEEILKQSGVKVLGRARRNNV